MFIRRLKLQTFWIILLVLSSLWVLAVFGPLFYSLLSPVMDLQSIVRALQGNGTPPIQAMAAVQQVFKQGGRLGRVIQVAHYVGFAATFQYGVSHTTRRTENTYLAWFEKIPRLILLIVRRYDTDGALQGYEIGSGEAVTLLIPLGLPLLAWVVSFLLVRKRRSAWLSDPLPEGANSR